MDPEESDDDGVIFKGSQLYSSFVNTGSLAAELSEECLEKQLQFADKQTCPEIKQDIAKKYKTGHAQTSLGSLSKWMLFVKEKCCLLLGCYKAEDILRKSRYQTLPVLLSSCLLEPDDADFLEAYVTHLQPASASTSTSAVSEWLYHGIIISYLTAYGYMRWSNPALQWPYQPFADILALVGLTLSGIRGVNSCYVKTIERHIQRNFCIIDQFLKTGESCIQTWKRSLRLVQEMELVARGFTLISQKNPLSRLEEGGSGQSMIRRQCPALRRQIFVTARETVLFYRDKTKHLFMLYPVSPSLDAENMFLAFESLHSYGPCMQEVSTLSDDRLYELTDGFSIASLKSICQLVNLHQSEFVKAMALLYHHDEIVFDDDDVCLISLLKDMSSFLHAGNQKLQQSYDFHKCIVTSHREPVFPKYSQPTQLQNISVAVHSLDLHLQAALNRVRSLSSWIQDQESAEESLSLSHDLIDGMMQPIKAELESCKGCWEEGLSRMEKSLKQTNTSDERTTHPDVKPSSTEAVELKEAVTAEEYIIEDQVFEAYTDSSQRQTDSSDWGIGLTKEEKERKKKEKQEALRMLSELKSVISVRAVETERREHAAIMRTSLKGHEQGTNLSSHIQGTSQSVDVQGARLHGDVKITSLHGQGLLPHPITLQENKSGHQTESSGQKTEEEKDSFNIIKLPVDHLDQVQSQSQMLSEQLITDSVCSDMSIDKTDHDINDDGRINEAIKQTDNTKATNTGTAEGNSSVASQLMDAGGTETTNCESQSIAFSTATSIKEFDETETDHHADDENNKNDGIEGKLRSPFSVVTNLGVRRLRRNRMLEDMDSDSDQEFPEQEKVVIEHVSGDSTEAVGDASAEPVATITDVRIHKSPLLDDVVSGSDLQAEVQVIETKQDDHFENTSAIIINDDKEIGMTKKIQEPEQFMTGIESQTDDDTEHVYSQMRERGETLEERLSRVAGVNLGLSSSIAAIAVARSRDFGGLAEDTFGGEVFGELSSSDSDGN